MTITIGYPAAVYGYIPAITSTRINYVGPANLAGNVDTFEIYMYSTGSNVKVGVFYQNDTDVFTRREQTTLGTVNTGSKQTFSGKVVGCDINDYVGIYGSAGNIYANNVNNNYYKSGDQFDAGEQTYSVNAGYCMALYATGVELPVHACYLRKGRSRLFIAQPLSYRNQGE
jgi:hypothetical protein